MNRLHDIVKLDRDGRQYVDLKDFMVMIIAWQRYYQKQGIAAVGIPMKCEDEAMGWHVTPERARCNLAIINFIKDVLGYP